MPNWKKVIVSGSDAILNKVTIPGNSGATTFTTNADTLIFSGSAYFTGSVNITGSLQATSITGSLLGTSSYADYALTASYALNGGGGGGGGSVFSYHQTASAVTWSVSHNLNTYTPIIQVYDDSYNQIIPSSISGSSVNTVQITFATAETGYAVLTTGGNVSVSISGSNAILVQSTPSTTWSFAHGLNEKYPVFTIFDSNDDVIVPVKIHADNVNTASIYFSTARTGTAVAANCGLSGSTFTSASYALTASYVANASSFPYTGSALITGSLGLTGSFNVTGSTTQTGNNTLIGNTTLSGSIIISGSTTPGNPTASVQIYGDIQQAGYHRFDPVTTNIDTSISASYIFVSGSTKDLYFSQNSAGYSNVTRLRWLESNLYTGILNGGVITSTPGSTTWNISSGSGIIVTQNASTGSSPYPTVQFVTWGNLTNIPITNSGSAKLTYVGIDNTGTPVQQIVPWGSTDINQFDTQINLGVVLHLSGSVSTGVFSSPQISYGQPQKTDDFLRAFGPLKISGHTLSPSGSSPTLSIKKTGGNAYKEGANYRFNANHPSTTAENDINVSKIYRYHISGSTPVIDTGIANAGYTTIDNDNYVDTTTGNLASVGNGSWSIQRVFWIPNSPTNAFIVYYGNAKYSTLLNAVNAKDSEPFVEAPNTATNAIFLGYIIIQGGNGRDLLNASETTIIPGGLFRSVGGVGSSGTSPIPITLEGLSDVSAATRTAGDLLYYNGTQWINSKILSGSYTLTGSLNATSFTGSLLGTSSFATSASYTLQALSSSYASNADLLDGKDSTIFATTGSNTFKGNQTISSSNAELLLTGGGSYGTVNFHNFNASIFDYVGQYHLRLQSNNQISNKTNNFVVLDSNDNVKVNITGSLIELSGSVSALNGFTGSFLGPLDGTASYASNSNLLDGLDSTVFLQTGSFNTFSSSYSTRITDVEATASAYVTTSGSLSTRVTNTEATASAYVTTSGSFSTRIANTEATASAYVTTSGSLSTRVTTIESKYATTGSNTYSGNQTITTGYVILTQVSQSLNFADDASAASGGVPLGGLYRNGNFIAIRIV